MTGQSPLLLRMSRSSCIVELTSSGALFLLPYSFICFSICIFPLKVLSYSLFISQKLDKSQLRNTAPAYQCRWSSGAVLELVLSPVFLRSTDKGLPRLGLLCMEQLEATNIFILLASLNFPWVSLVSLCFRSGGDFLALQEETWQKVPEGWCTLQAFETVLCWRS